jgi:N-methylhydantoinase A/oxoprolinase/acetone carboxylase beta subunit
MNVDKRLTYSVLWYTKGVNMGQKVSMLNKIDDKLVSKFKDKSIHHSITTNLEFNINIAGTEFKDIEEAIIHAYRCGLAAMGTDQFKKVREGTSAVDQDELYNLLRKGHSIQHKADFLREIAKEWFPIESHEEKKIKTVHLELIELANFLEK